MLRGFLLGLKAASRLFNSSGNTDGKIEVLIRVQIECN